MGITADYSLQTPFTGHKHNDDIGLIYMNARYYLPNTNRFLTPDTIIPDPTNPQSFNRYSYVLNQPLRFTDPSGHGECDALDDEVCQTVKPVAPLPSSVVYIWIQYTEDYGVENSIRGTANRGIGVAIDSNAILTHHHLSTGSNHEIIGISVYSRPNRRGRLLSATVGEFEVITDNRLGDMQNAITLIVFKEDFIEDGDTASLIEAGDHLNGALALQAVSAGARDIGRERGLYEVEITDGSAVFPRPQNQGTFNALFVEPDYTRPGDSGAPLFYKDRVVGINNQGSGRFGAITDIGLIRSLIIDATEALRG